MSVVRPARVSDFGQCEQLAKLAKLELPVLGGMTLDFSQLKLNLLTSDGYGMWVADDDEYGIIGLMISVLHQGSFFNEVCCENVLFYVMPDFRGTNIPWRLVKEMEKWAALNNARYIQLGTIGGANIERNLRFFTWAGYSLAGINTIKVLSNGRITENPEADKGRTGVTASSDRADGRTEDRH